MVGDPSYEPYFVIGNLANMKPLASIKIKVKSKCSDERKALSELTIVKDESILRNNFKSIK